MDQLSKYPETIKCKEKKTKNSYAMSNNHIVLSFFLLQISWNINNAETSLIYIDVEEINMLITIFLEMLRNFIIKGKAGKINYLCAGF